jgi:hypothetical protein
VRLINDSAVQQFLQLLRTCFSVTGSFSSRMERQSRSISFCSAGVIGLGEGDATQALQKAAMRISAEYEVPYLAHATMEPLNCLVDLRLDSCEIWTGTQFQSLDHAAAVKLTGLQQAKCSFTLCFSAVALDAVAVQPLIL